MTAQNQWKFSITQSKYLHRQGRKMRIGKAETHNMSRRIKAIDWNREDTEIYHTKLIVRYPSGLISRLSLKILHDSPHKSKSYHFQQHSLVTRIDRHWKLENIKKLWRITLMKMLFKRLHSTCYTTIRTLVVFWTNPVSGRATALFFLLNLFIILF